LRDETDEVMLAQEQGVVMRDAGRAKELEGRLGGELEGTLLLTNHRLIFVCTHEKEDDLKTTPFGKMPLVYSDVEDLASIDASGNNLIIELSSISSVKGHRGHVTKPSLEVKWQQGTGEQGRVFIELLSGRSRRRNLNDWTRVIERLKTGDQKLIQLPKPPAAETPDGRIYLVLTDMQRKGVFEVKEEAEKRFGLKLDPDEVQAACDRLCNIGLLEKMPDSSGDIYYQKRSPLGEDELSS
jgi:hypothetical protein